ERSVRKFRSLAAHVEEPAAQLCGGGGCRGCRGQRGRRAQLLRQTGRTRRRRDEARDRASEGLPASGEQIAPPGVIKEKSTSPKPYSDRWTRRRASPRKRQETCFWR